MTDENIDFYPIFMSSVHDLKNSLIMSLGTLDMMETICHEKDPEMLDQVHCLQYELQRSNNGLIQLLSLYKMDKNLCSVNLDQHNAHEFLHEVLLQNRSLRDSKKFHVDLECDEDLDWYFDRELIFGIIGTIINNACRYAKERILVRGYEKDGFFEIVIEDDGGGFPEFILNADGDYSMGVSFSSGSTGLGLYFAAKVAELHRRGDVKGSVRLENIPENGGGRFTLILP